MRSTRTRLGDFRHYSSRPSPCVARYAALRLLRFGRLIRVKLKRPHYFIILLVSFFIFPLIGDWLIIYYCSKLCRPLLMPPVMLTTDALVQVMQVLVKLLPVWVIFWVCFPLVLGSLLWWFPSSSSSSLCLSNQLYLSFFYAGRMSQSKSMFVWCFQFTRSQSASTAASICITTIAEQCQSCHSCFVWKRRRGKVDRRIATVSFLGFARICCGLTGCWSLRPIGS